MSMHLKSFGEQIIKTMLSQIIEDYDNLEQKELQKRIIMILKELKSASWFLISYDFKDNNNVLKNKLLNKKPKTFWDYVCKKTLPESTLIWRGPTTATTRDAFNNFKNQVTEIIMSEDLDAELSKTIVVEIIDPNIVVDER